MRPFHMFKAHEYTFMIQYNNYHNHNRDHDKGNIQIKIIGMFYNQFIARWLLKFFIPPYNVTLPNIKKLGYFCHFASICYCITLFLFQSLCFKYLSRSTFNPLSYYCTLKIQMLLFFSYKLYLNNKELKQIMYCFWYKQVLFTKNPET